MSPSWMRQRLHFSLQRANQETRSICSISCLKHLVLTPDSLCVCAAPFVGMNFLRLMWLAIAYAITQFGITAVSLSSDMLANASSGAHGLCTVTMSVSPECCLACELWAVR